MKKLSSRWFNLTKSIIIILIFVTFAVEMEANPDTLYIDLSTALQIALQQSPNAVKSSMAEESARLQWKAAASEYYPSVDLSLLTPTFQETQLERNIFVPKLDEEGNPISGQFVEQRQWVKTQNRQWQSTVSLSQPLPTGGHVDLLSSMYQRFYHSDLTGVDEFEEEINQSYRLEVVQEFLAGNLRKIARDKANLSYQRVKGNSSISKNTLSYSVLESYYNLLLLELELEISREDLSASREAAQLARRKFEAGLIAEVEAMELEVEVLQKEASLYNEVATYENNLDRFRTLLGLEIDQPVKIIGEPEFEPLTVEREKSRDAALEKRLELSQAEIDIKQALFGIKDAQRPYSPRVAMNAFYDLDKRDEFWKESFASNLGDFNVNRGLSVSVSIPLLTLGRKQSNVQEAQINLRENQFNREQLRRSIILEVRQAIRNLEEAKKRYQTSLRAQEIAEQSYQINRQRFENGQVTARVWIEAQLAFKRNRIEALRALIDHTLAVAQFQLAVGEDIFSLWSVANPGEEE